MSKLHIGIEAMELANHTQFTVATDVQVYFCDPSMPGQCGNNENRNGALLVLSKE